MELSKLLVNSKGELITIRQYTFKIIGLFEINTNEISGICLMIKL